MPINNVKSSSSSNAGRGGAVLLTDTEEEEEDEAKGIGTIEGVVVGTGGGIVTGCLTVEITGGVGMFSKEGEIPLVVLGGAKREEDEDEEEEDGVCITVCGAMFGITSDP